jgi:hypothetical protein
MTELTQNNKRIHTYKQQIYQVKIEAEVWSQLVKKDLVKASFQLTELVI